MMINLHCSIVGSISNNEQKIKVLRCPSSGWRTSEFSSAWQMLQQSAMKLGVLPAESSRRQRWRRRWVLFLFTGRQASGRQQISGAVCWPQMKLACS